MSSLPPGIRLLLEKQLDWDSEGVGKDLHAIAHHMLDWEVKLSSHLNLTDIDVSDIKEEFLRKPELQRSVSKACQRAINISPSFPSLYADGRH